MAGSCIVLGATQYRPPSVRNCRKLVRKSLPIRTSIRMAGSIRYIWRPQYGRRRWKSGRLSTWGSEGLVRVQTVPTRANRRRLTRSLRAEPVASHRAARRAANGNSRARRGRSGDIEHVRSIAERLLAIAARPATRCTAAARDRETEFAGQINSLTLDEFLVLPRPRESGQHLARELARASAAVIRLTHARDSALERDDRVASEVETRPQPR